MATIIERMNEIHWRMQIERRSGVSPSDRDLFLATCRALELSGIASSWNTEEDTDRDELCWEPFDNWNDAPSMLAKREG